MPLPPRLRPALPAHQGAATANWRRMAARDQTRRLSRHRAQGGWTRAALQPPWQRPDGPLPLIVEALAKLRSRSCIIDGEAVCCDDDGVPSFDRIRYRRHDADVFLYAFDLIELNGDDLRREPLDVRKATLASVLTKTAPGLRLNEHIVPHRVRARRQDGARGHRVEAQGVALHERPFARLAQDDPGGKARGRERIPGDEEQNAFRSSRGYLGR